MGARLSRAARITLDQASGWLRLAIVTGPFIWLPGIAILMAFAGQYRWITEETAYSVTCWAAAVCLVLWLPASPLVRFLVVAVIEAIFDAVRGIHQLAQRLSNQE